MKKILLLLLLISNIAYGQTETPTNTPTNTPTSTPTATPTAYYELVVSKSSLTTEVSSIGQVISYIYDVENTGNRTLTGIILTDNNIDATVNCSGTTLTASSTMECSATHTVTSLDMSGTYVTNYVSSDTSQTALEV